MKRMADAIKRWADSLRRKAMTLWFACRDSATPWTARLLCALVVSYALSPIDLIPDFIPILGFVDDLLLLPGLIWLALRLLPSATLAAAVARADTWIAERRERPQSRLGAVLVLGIWIIAAMATAAVVCRYALRTT